MTLKFGKQPATHDDRDLLLDYYLDASKLPKIPQAFGHSTDVSSWGMLANDRVGDCAIAGPAHETMLWTTLGGHPTSFTDAGVLSDYSAITGYDPNDPSTDRGSNVRAVANYRRKTGMIDANGNRHKIGAYVALRPGHVDHIKAAIYLFDGVGIGFVVPDTAMRQFQDGQPWDLVPGAQPVGGHYVPVFDYDAAYLTCITWGEPQRMTWRFFEAQCDEAFAYLSVERMTNGHSPEGFKLADLQRDLLAVAS